MLKRWMVAVMPALVLAFSFPAGTDTLLILHTNDLHDHVRPGYDGVGGIASVSGYIQSVRSQRRDVLVLDAGDVTEKGDLVAFRTQSRITYEAMGRIGFVAGALGNHDLDQGIPHMKECGKLAGGMALLCLNLIPPGAPRPFPASKVFEVDGVRVGVIGLAIPKGGEYLDITQCGRALEEEARKLSGETHLQVALGHIGSRDCAALSALAPSVDVFVGGHTHELIRDPIRVEGTGALIVQAGQYARHVGRLELTVDLDAKKVMSSQGSPVEMRHAAVPCDETMLAWIRENERALCPEATRVVARAESEIGFLEAGRLAAVALRDKSQADIGFCHTGQIIRSGLPAGPIDINALFLTGGQRGYDIVALRLKGQEIEDYMRGLAEKGMGRTEWAGFQGSIEPPAPGRPWRIRTNLDAEHNYRAVMPRLEWETRFLRVLGERFPSRADAERRLSVTACGFSFTDAVADYAESLSQRGVSLAAHLKTLAVDRTLEILPVR